MSRYATIPVLIIFCILTLFQATVSAWSGPMVHIADGDTITVLRYGEKVRVRLYGIDTPESDQPFGGQAEKFAEKTIDNNRVEVVPKDKDRYGMTVAMVYIEGDGECLN